MEWLLLSVPVRLFVAVEYETLPWVGAKGYTENFQLSALSALCHIDKAVLYFRKINRPG